jgi:hypothetical protein
MKDSPTKTAPEPALDAPRMATDLALSDVQGRATPEPSTDSDWLSQALANHPGLTAETAIAIAEAHGF